MFGEIVQSAQFLMCPARLREQPRCLVTFRVGKVDTTHPNTPVGCLDLSFFMLHIIYRKFLHICHFKGVLAADCTFLLCCIPLTLSPIKTKNLQTK